MNRPQADYAQDRERLQAGLTSRRQAGYEVKVKAVASGYRRAAIISYMVQIGLEDAENKLSDLFTMALLGETVVITRQGDKQSIRLTPIPPPQAPTGFGMLRERLADLPSDWNSPEVEAEFFNQFEALKD